MCEANSSLSGSKLGQSRPQESEQDDKWNGAASDVVGIWRSAISGHMKGIVSGCEVNWLIDGLCGERLPAINFAHVDLA
jgi:hypothetical protein